MPNRRSRWLRLVVASSAVALAVFAILELVLRLTVGGVYSTLYRPDSRLLYRLAPGSEKLFQHPAAHGGARIRVAVNRAGFRGEELLARGEALRIAVYGDSFVAAEFSELQDTFGEQLESRLVRTLEQPVEVINAGVVGYGPDQALLRMRDELAELRPELVILAVYAGNDFGDLLRNKLFRRGDSGELAENGGHVVGATAFRLRWSRYAPVLYKVVARAYYNWTHRAASYAEGDAAAAQVRQIETWLDERRAEWRSARAGELGVSNLLRDTPDVDIATAPKSESARAKVALMKLVLGAVRDTAARAGVPLLLLVVPSPIDACEVYPLGQVDPARFPEYRRQRVSSLLAEMARELGIPSLDLFPEFRRNDSCGLFFPADAHWNNAGQKLAAKLTAEAIARAGLLEPVATVEGSGQRTPGVSDGQPHPSEP